MDAIEPHLIERFQRQRAHLTRCQRSITFDFAIAVLGGEDCEELRFEYHRLQGCVTRLDRWIEELQVSERGRWAVEGVVEMLGIEG